MHPTATPPVYSISRIYSRGGSIISVELDHPTDRHGQGANDFPCSHIFVDNEEDLGMCKFTSDHSVAILDSSATNITYEGEMYVVQPEPPVTFKTILLMIVSAMSISFYYF